MPLIEAKVRVAAGGISSAKEKKSLSGPAWLVGGALVAKRKKSLSNWDLPFWGTPPAKGKALPLPKKEKEKK